MTQPPVFVVSAPRSGSTVFFELLSSHADFGWLTNYEAKFPGAHFGGALRRILECKHWHITGRKKEHAPTSRFNRLIPKRAEGYDFWTRETGVDFHRSWLWSGRANAETAKKLRHITRRVLFWQGKPLFSTKFTGPGRIGYLLSLYPDARFIHLVRDPHAQIRSLMKVSFWNRGGGHEQLWWRNDIPPFLQDYLRAAQQTNDPIAVAAAQNRAVIEGIRREAQTLLTTECYQEVRYEDFIARPRQTIERLWQSVGLAPDETNLERIDSYPLQASRNQSLSNELAVEDKQTINEWLEKPLPKE